MSQPPPPFKKSWIVRSDPKVSPLCVKVPMTKGDAPPPPFLRLEARRRGILGRLTKRPVLRPAVADGSNDTWLTVSESLKLAIGEKPVTVSPASEGAYRRYRLSRSAGSVFAAVATIIGALLLALGALGPKSDLGKGLLIAGGVLSILAAVGVVVSVASPGRVAPHRMRPARIFLSQPPRTTVDQSEDGGGLVIVLSHPGWWRDHVDELVDALTVAAQAPDATRVAGYRTWQSLGRQVRKGERGIQILAPVTYRPRQDDSDDPPLWSADWGLLASLAAVRIWLICAQARCSAPEWRSRVHGASTAAGILHSGRQPKSASTPRCGLGSRCSCKARRC